MNKTLICAFLFITTLFTACNTVSELKEGGTLVVGTNAEFPPFAFVRSGEVMGFEIDMAKEIATRLGYSIRFVDLPFDALVPEISLGSLHMVAAGMTPTPERAQRVHFSKVYLNGDPLVMLSLKRFFTPESIKELAHMRVVVNTGYTADSYITEMLENAPLRLATPMDGFLSLRSQRADVFVTARNTVLPFLQVQGGGEDFVMTPLEGTSENTAIMISKKHPQLVPKVNKVIQEMMDDGTVESFKKKWGVS
jgi:ABC-type amino acid transport substrate-binding protein